MNDWVVETPSFEEDLMNNNILMLNQNGVNRVIKIIKEKDKEIERLNNIIAIVNKKLKNISITSSTYNYQCMIKEVINMIQDLKGSDEIV